MIAIHFLKWTSKAALRVHHQLSIKLLGHHHDNLPVPTAVTVVDAEGCWHAQRGNKSRFGRVFSNANLCLDIDPLGVRYGV